MGVPPSIPASGAKPRPWAARLPGILPRMPLRLLALLLLGSLLASGARADEPVGTAATPGAAAADELDAAVRRALELMAESEDDDGALIALALGPDPDPWLLADELLARAGPAAARRFARAAHESKGDGVGLAAWLAGGGDAREAPARRAAFREAQALAAQGEAAAALARLDVAHGGVHDVLGARCSFARGEQLRALGEAERAIRSFERAAQIAGELGWARGRSLALHEAALQAFRRAQHGRAADLWQERLEVERGRGTTPDLIATWENLGLARANLGEFAAALACHTEALDLCRALQDTAGIARSLVNLGVVHDRRGDARGAEHAYREALALLEASVETARPQLAIGSRSMACEQWGDFTDAIARCQHSMQANEEREQRFALEGEAPDDQGPVQQGVCFSLGKLYRRLGDAARARRRYEEALRLSERLGDDFGRAQALAALAQLDADAGRHAEAVAGYGQAIALQTAIGDRVGEAWSRVYLGDVHLAAGAAPEAVAAYAEARAGLERLEFRTSVVVVLARLSRAQLAAGDPEAARASAEAALAESTTLGDVGSALLARQTLARIHLARGEAARALGYVRDAARDLRSVAHGLSVADGISTREYFARLFELAARAALALEDPAELLFVLEMGRAGTLLDALGSRGTVRDSVVPPKLQAAEEAARAAEARAQRRLQDARTRGDRRELRARREELEAARRDLQETISRIQLLSRSAADMVYAEPVELRRLQQALLPREAFVLYGVFEEEAVALALGPRWARIVRLGPSRRLQEAVERSGWTDPDADPAAPTRGLAEVLVDPLGLPPEVERLFISPHGVLHVTPFSALLPHLELVWLPSATTWILLRDQHARRGGKVLALGDPQYAPGPTAEGKPARGVSGLTPLPGTRAEAIAVGDVLLLGDEASEARLRATLRIPTRWRAVHLACHGLLDAERPWQSSLALTPDHENDGFLTVLDLLRLEVSADLAVLSACETGRGAIYSAEGILGLSRAFMHAGAPRVLASLWKVDDEATRALMEEFYVQWNRSDGKGVSAVVALHRAQAHVRAQPRWRHPYYWAAWVLWGLPD